MKSMYIIIVVVCGFALIGVGVALWLDSHVIEKHTTSIKTITLNQHGDPIGYNFGEAFFERYEIVEKQRNR